MRSFLCQDVNILNTLSNLKLTCLGKFWPLFTSCVSFQFPASKPIGYRAGVGISKVITCEVKKEHRQTTDITNKYDEQFVILPWT